MSRLLTFGGPYDPYRDRKRPRRESPVGSVRRHQVQYKGRELRRGRAYAPMVCLTGSWLGDIGFPYGRDFQVEAEDGRLVLQAV